MREIKFKVWNTIDKSFLSRQTAVFFACLLEAMNGSKYYEAVQYTGLKDSKGAEIYEGDIVRHNTSRAEVVKWDEDYGAWYMCLFSSISDQEAGPYSNYEIEIIGNIYENPELLEADL